MKRKLLALLAVVTILLTGCGTQSEGETTKDYAIKYTLKINPEFEIYADEEMNVVSIEPLNEDAEQVLSSLGDVEGTSVVETFSAITEEAKAEGYMTEEKGNTVDITIEEIDEEAMTVCPVCEGCGTVLCWDCQGTGGDDCILCNHTGTIENTASDRWEWQTCSECDGSGYVTEPDENCWACHGSGTCYLCGGTGYDIVTNEYGETVYTSEGTPETYPCTFCKGSGKCTNCLGKPCHRCNNEGKGENPGYDYVAVAYEEGTVCPDCSGTGFIPCGCELNGYRWCPCCWGSGVDGTGYENYDYNLTPEQNWYNNR